MVSTIETRKKRPSRGSVMLRSILAVICACIVSGCDVPEDVVQPRTPQALVAYFSQLSVPRNAKVSHYDDGFVIEHGVIKNEGGLFITLQLDTADMRKLVSDADKNGFIPIGSVPADTIALWYNGSPEGTAGLYRHELGVASRENEQLIVLDTIAYELRLMRIKITQKW